MNWPNNIKTSFITQRPPDLLLVESNNVKLSCTMHKHWSQKMPTRMDVDLWKLFELQPLKNMSVEAFIKRH